MCQTCDGKQRLIKLVINGPLHGDNIKMQCVGWKLTLEAANSVHWSMLVCTRSLKSLKAHRKASENLLHFSKAIFIHRVLHSFGPIRTHAPAAISRYLAFYYEILIRLIEFIVNWHIWGSQLWSLRIMFFMIHGIHRKNQTS